MKKKTMFCKLYGNTIRNRILSYFLTLKDLDFAISDVAEDEDISKPKVYQVIEELEEQGFLAKSRKVAGTQLYKLNKENDLAKIVLKAFEESIKFQEKGLIEPKPVSFSGSKACTMSVRHC